MKLELSVNGRRRRVAVEPSRTLLEVLREDLGLTGTKHGCEQGECGACTVLLDGKPVYACLTLAAQAGGAEVVTIEGVPREHPLVAAFVEEGAVQCGYCTPGMILAAKAFLESGAARGRRPARADVQEALSGNLCRCTGYCKIVSAVESAAERMGKAPRP
ncbi:MAG: (2Fe-2S)-binding protein [Elusimicrobia bacterium]|nr:(2Fe-2S)-binding protein [Elusimicrobiota bacterium]